MAFLSVEHLERPSWPGYREAEAAIQRARVLDPLSPPVNTSLGLCCFVQGRYEEAREHFPRTLEVDPNSHLAHWWASR